MTPEEEKQAEEAKRYIRANKRLLIQTFADPAAHKKTDRPVSIFMAGSPGAGKTEFSKRIIEALSQWPGDNPVRIDADEIRAMIDSYTGDNAHVFQGASARGVEMLFDHVLARNLNVILDGTFALKEKGFSNIERSLSHGRLVEIYYLFQEPEVAWDFTKKREVLERRRITKEVFVKAFFAAHENVVEAKTRFGDKIRLNVVLKDIRDPSNYQVHFNVASVDKLVPWKYSHDTLTRELQ
jgi:UDP-N-acetylglucosamine kinase